MTDSWKLPEFANMAINTSCRAFYREDFFEGEHPEFYPELSFKKEHPRIKSRDIEKNGKIYGTFHFVNDSIADLYLVCKLFGLWGEEYYVFFNDQPYTIGDDPKVYPYQDWCVWTPFKKFGVKSSQELAYEEVA